MDNSNQSKVELNVSNNKITITSTTHDNNTPSIINRNPLTPELTQEEQNRFVKKKKKLDKDKFKFKRGEDLKIAAQAYFDSIDARNAERRKGWGEKGDTMKRAFTSFPYLKEGLLLHIGVGQPEYACYCYSEDDSMQDAVRWIDLMVANNQLEAAFTHEISVPLAQTYLTNHGILSHNSVKELQNRGSGNSNGVNIVVIQTPEQLAEYNKKGNVDDMLEDRTAQIIETTVKEIE